jgi:hypothetical protein
MRAKMIFFGLFGLVVNGILYLFGLWMPKLLIVAVALLFVALVFIPPDDAANM